MCNNIGNKAISGWEIFNIDCLNAEINGIVLLGAPLCLAVPLKSFCRSKEECKSSNQPVTNQPLLQLVFHLDNASLLS